MLPISEAYLNSPCEIRNMENFPILTGRVKRFIPGGVEIVSKGDKLPLIRCNEFVKVSVMNNSLGFRVLVGQVYLSTAEFLRVVDIQDVMDYDKRNFFRVRVDMEAKAFPVTGDEEKTENIPLRNPITTNIRDISLSGLYFSCSNVDLATGDRLIIKMNLYDKSIPLLCKVVRKDALQPDREAGYGCGFLDNSGWQFDLLCKYLFDCQRLQIQAMKHSPEEYAQEQAGPSQEPSEAPKNRKWFHKKQTR